MHPRLPTLTSLAPGCPACPAATPGEHPCAGRRASLVRMHGNRKLSCIQTTDRGTAKPWNAFARSPWCRERESNSTQAWPKEAEKPWFEYENGAIACHARPIRARLEGYGKGYRQCAPPTLAGLLGCRSLPVTRALLRSPECSWWAELLREMGRSAPGTFYSIKINLHEALLTPTPPCNVDVSPTDRCCASITGQQRLWPKASSPSSTDWRA